MFQKLWPFNNSHQNGASQTHEPLDHGVSTKVKPIHASFNKGIPLNMKIVIRGDIRTGKTSVFERLQGHPFRSEHDYRTTAQIQVANIPWQYAPTKDIIKVEIWDVVDKGIQSGDLKASSNSALKIDNNTPTSPTKTKPAPDVDSAPHAAFALDASTIDVYRNTNGVILVYDVSKPWTFDYAAKALADTPTNIPVLILSNFSDDSNPRPVVASDRVEALMREHNNARAGLPCAPANLVRHLETSMKTGLGLKEIHESFGIPFLNVLRETHRKQFEQKTLEIEELLRTLDGHAHDHSARRHSQKSLHTAPVLSSKDEPVAKKLPRLPASIQTSDLAIHPEPRTSSPTSPARKTRNEHTNVDILSPTPLSAHAPAVLLDFNTGKIEDEFFQNVDLNSTTPSAVGQDQSLLANNEAQEEPELDGNPMVARDEDIGDSSRDELTESTLHQAHAPVWIPGQVEKELLSRHMVKGAEEARLQDEEESEEEDNGLEQQHDPKDFEAMDDSDCSTHDFAPRSQRNHHQDSDTESQIDFPIASAMYFEHEREHSGFARHSVEEGEEAMPHSQPTSSAILSGYEEIADDHGDNPWGSTGNLLHSAAVLPKNVEGLGEDEDAEQSAEDRNEDTPISVPSTAESTHHNARSVIGLDNGKRSVDLNTLLTNGHKESDVSTEEPSPTLNIQSESTGVSAEDEGGDESNSALTSAASFMVVAADEGSEADKKKTKKKGKKKGKKGK
ncbi:Rab-like protein 6 [Mortierella alpina]|uniref:Rab-like protein 6 n=1 Tax=Mortierella alpina TaxID=64518 RepID=A0A9P6M4M9_MORAP|nr:Rab-like protein 6 [Mortierella alpina]